MPNHLPFRVILALAAGIALAAIAQGAAPPQGDTAPPTILVLPTDEGAAGDRAVEIRARIVDASGVGKVVAHVRSEGQETYSAVTMRPSGAEDDEYVATVPGAVRPGASIAYYVEATDRLGNGPITNGNPRAPFVVRGPPAGPAPTVAGGDDPPSRGHALPALAGLAVLALLVGWQVQRGRRRVERNYWLRLLAPIMAKSGAERAEALEQLCSRTECHPLRGYSRITRREVMDWLAKLAPLRNHGPRPDADLTGPTAPAAPARTGQPRERTETPKTEPARPAGAAPTRDRWGNRARRAKPARVETAAVAAAPAPGRAPGKHGPAPDLPAAEDDCPLERLDEEIFWIQLFEPILPLSSRAASKALADLASRPIDHPRGRRLFDLPTLRTWLDWTRLNDPRAASPAPAAPGIDPALGAPNHRPDRPGRSSSGSEGMTLVEILVVLAVLALVVGVTAINLRPLEAPVRTGGQLLRSFFEDTRARAIATTTVHRVRPLTSHALIVEHADSCSSGTWTLDPDRELELPTGVELSDATWSLCYSSRGLASQNLVVTLGHTGYPSEQLEILAGGAVRTLN